jgi:hypothetical protein
LQRALPYFHEEPAQAGLFHGDRTPSAALIARANLVIARAGDEVLGGHCTGFVNAAQPAAAARSSELRAVPVIKTPEQPACDDIEALAEMALPSAVPPGD